MSVEIILGGLANKTSTTGNSHCMVAIYNIRIVPITKTQYSTTLEPLDQRCFDFKEISLNSSQNDALNNALKQFQDSVMNFKDCLSSKSHNYYHALSKCLISEIFNFELNFPKCFDEAYEVFEDNAFECLRDNILKQHIVLNLEEI